MYKNLLLAVVLSSSVMNSFQAMEEPIFGAPCSDFFRDFVFSLVFSYPAHPTQEEAALFEAIDDNQPGILRAILQKNPKLVTHARTSEDLFLLLYAAQLGRAQMVAELLKAGAPVDQTEHQGFALLLPPTKNQNTPPVSTEYQPLTGFTALMAAAKWGHLEAARQLLAAKANVALRDETKRTACDYAQKYGHSNLVALLTQTPGNN